MITVVNAVKSLTDANFTPISQMDILDTVTTGNWKLRMSEKGDNGRRGLPLPLLKEIAQSSLDAYEIRYSRVEMIQATRNPRQMEATIRTVTDRLNRYETDGGCVVIAHFDQGAFVRTLNIPHISPVGAYDSEYRLVTILDVDPDQQYPYTIPFHAFYQGISSNYYFLFSAFGYKTGGCICIHLN